MRWQEYTGEGNELCGVLRTLVTDEFNGVEDAGPLVGMPILPHEPGQGGRGVARIGEDYQCGVGDPAGAARRRDGEALGFESRINGVP
jgi:hypothetical protein